MAQLQRASRIVSIEAVLRLNLADVTPDKIACFKSQEKLVTTDLALELRPRAIQKPRGD
jgi:hypothetical protein